MGDAGRRRQRKIRRSALSHQKIHTVEKSCQNIHTVSGQKLPEAQDEKIGDQRLIRSFEYAIH